MNYLNKSIKEECKINMIKITKIKSLTEYIEVVSNTRMKWAIPYKREILFPWYRGLSSSEHKLLPNIYWKDGTYRYEFDLRYDFKLKSHPFLGDSFIKEPNDWDLYYLMQHYGMPTRLLDWSEGSLISLHFALSGRSKTGTPCVWMLNPFAMNKIFHDDDVLFDKTDLVCQKYLLPLWSRKKMAEKPLAILPEYTSKRLAAQRGCFTIFGKSQLPLEEYKQLHNHLHRIDIETESCGLLADELLSTGISEATLFPDLSGLSKDITSYWTERDIK